MQRWKETRDSSLCFHSQCCFIFSNQTSGSALCCCRLFFIPALPKWHIIHCDQQGVLAATFAFWIPVTIRQAIIHHKTKQPSLGKITTNLVIHRKEKQSYLHKTVCGAHHPRRIMLCSVWAEFKQASAGFGLSLHSFLHFPRCMASCFQCRVFLQLLPLAVFPQTVRKQTAAGRQTGRGLLLAEFYIWEHYWLGCL